MATIYECLKQVVGLAQFPCPCEPQPSDAEFDTSKSGLFLTAGQYAIPLKLPMKATDCQENFNGWTLLEQSREAGVREYLKTLQSETKGLYNQLPKFEGYIGDTRHNFVLQGKKAYLAVAYAPRVWKGVKMTINTLQVWLDQPGTYTVTAHYDTKLRQGITTPAFSQAVTINVGQPYGEHTLATPWAFDLSNQQNEPETIYLIVERGSANPRNITFDCGCGNERPYETYFKALGMDADSVADFYNVRGNNHQPMGIRAAVTISCGFDWLCQSWDWDNDPFAVLSADAMYLFGIRSLIASLLLSPDINPFTYLMKEDLAKRGEIVDALATQRMDWLKRNIPTGSQDCLTCDSRWSLGMARS